MVYTGFRGSFFQFKKASEVIVLSLSVAVVIMAETLLAENNFAQKNGYRIDDNTELFGIFHRKYGCGFYGLLSDKTVQCHELR